MSVATCDICGKVATTDDGIVGAYLCDSFACLEAAWDRAFPNLDLSPDPQPAPGPD